MNSAFTRQFDEAFHALSVARMALDTALARLARVSPAECVKFETLSLALDKLGHGTNADGSDLRRQERALLELVAEVERALAKNLS